MWKDFKKFIARGNVLDLAVGVIIGAAFSKIVTTLVEGIIMPPIGWLTSGIDFSSLYFDPSGRYSNLQDPKAIEEAIKSGAPLIMYGKFINDLIIFFIVAFVIFLIAKWALKLFAGLEPPPSPPSSEEKLLTEIRDILKENKN